jgi:folylpolyglutamate synthase
MDVLGQSLEEITWHKAGIIKEGSPVFTSIQPPEALRVITSRSVELKASCIYVAPPSQSYNGTINDIGIAGNHQFENASLAVQLCRQWMTEMRKWPGKTITGCQDTNGIPIADTFDLPATFIKGLHECYWPGRCELIKQKGVSYYVDGAHTFKSLLECSKWFKQAASDEALQVQGPVSRILIFNFSGRRDADRLMSNLLDLGFDHALFCPNITTLDDISTDQTNYNASTSEVVRRCYNNELIWQRAMNVDKCETKVFMSISQTIEHVGILREEKYGTYLQVLVCGSLHLVGGVMKVLDYSVSTC